LQQMPSAQNLEAHSVPFAQFAPFILRPQLPMTHAWPVTHCPFWVQVSKHAFFVASHEYGAQTMAGPGLQRPRPSQARAPMTAAPWHWPGLHIEPAGKRRQAPAPSQVPSKPQVETSLFVHPLAVRGANPAVIDEHVPTEFCAAHVLHASVQAEPQQTPSAQKPLEHSPGQAHGCPTAFLMLASPQVAPSPLGTLPPSGPGPIEPPVPACPVDVPPSPAVPPCPAPLPQLAARDVRRKSAATLQNKPNVFMPPLIRGTLARTFRW
jgi:hypothetical protein